MSEFSNTVGGRVFNALEKQFDKHRNEFDIVEIAITKDEFCNLIAKRYGYRDDTIKKYWSVALRDGFIKEKGDGAVLDLDVLYEIDRYDYEANGEKVRRDKPRPSPSDSPMRQIMEAIRQTGKRCDKFTAKEVAETCEANNIEFTEEHIKQALSEACKLGDVYCPQFGVYKSVYE